MCALVLWIAEKTFHMRKCLLCKYDLGILIRAYELATSFYGDCILHSVDVDN